MDNVEEIINVVDASDAEVELPAEGRNTGRKRSYHNILERKRRNHIKDGYLKLRDAVPTICNKKVSRIQILKRAIEHIRVQKEEIRKRENHFQEMSERSECLKKLIDFMKTKDFVVR